jgi:ribosomal protein S18 acetylase RimI-like enzyme
MIIRPTTEDDWTALKAIRLAALLDAPTAFGVSHQAAAAQTEAQWRERAAAATASRPKTTFWLAFGDAASNDAIGMIGAGVDGHGHYNLIGMWVAPARRGSGAARGLVDAVKARAIELGHRRVVLDVAPENARAARFYQNQGFVFIDEWEPLASHPAIRVQKMAWQALAQEPR